MLTKRPTFPSSKSSKKYPFMKISIHYSGVLWDFFKKNHPEFLKILRELVEKGQLEMMTGGYYEPILAVIPDEDKVGDLFHHSRALSPEDSPGDLYRDPVCLLGEHGSISSDIFQSFIEIFFMKAPTLTTRFETGRNVSA
jgi:hypothetical protein